MERDSESSDKIFLGVDGGGTKTVCIVMNRRQKVLGQSRTGSSNRNSVGDETARANLQHAIQEALASAGCQTAMIGAICVGMAGVDRPAERTLISSWIHEILPGVPNEIQNDALIALAGGTQGDLFGVAAVSGTGMIVYGIDREGRTRRAGGWGPLFRDKGSGYAIGKAALTAIAQAVDGLGPATALEGAILDYLDLSTPQALIPWAYADLSWARIAELAPLVVECAQQNDPVAQTIIQEAAIDLAAAVEVVVRNLHLLNEQIPIVMAGRNLLPGLLSNLVVQHLGGLTPNAQIIRTNAEPALGAALLALKHLQKGSQDEHTAGN
ncbi:MAG: BadF/BadG/BcrA/BcrD ATPase family protein [Caldilineaceae bacterium]